MALVKDFVLQTANAPGTATFSLIAPPSGRRSFVSANGAGQVFYVAFDNTSFEEGIGTVAAGSPDTLSRDTVTDNSLGTTAKINFTGTTTIWCDIPAARAIYASPDNLSVPHGSRVLSGLAAGVAVSDAPRLDQVGWQVISSTTVGSAVSSVTFSLPSAYDRYRLEWDRVSPTATAPMIFQASVDGGSTYLSAASSYSAVAYTISNTSIVVGNNANIYLDMTVSALTANASFGYIEFNAPATPNFISDGFAMGAGPVLTQTRKAGYVSTSSRLTNVLFACAGTTVAGGKLRLLGG